MHLAHLINSCLICGILVAAPKPPVQCGHSNRKHSTDIKETVNYEATKDSCTSPATSESRCFRHAHKLKCQVALQHHPRHVST